MRNALHLEVNAGNLLPGERGLPRVKRGVRKPRRTHVRRFMRSSQAQSSTERTQVSKQQQQLLGANSKTKAVCLENIPVPPGWQETGIPRRGGQTAVARAQLLLLPTFAPS